MSAPRSAPRLADLVDRELKRCTRLYESQPLLAVMLIARFAEIIGEAFIECGVKQNDKVSSDKVVQAVGIAVRRAFLAGVAQGRVSMVVDTAFGTARDEQSSTN